MRVEHMIPVPAADLSLLEQATAGYLRALDWAEKQTGRALEAQRAEGRRAIQEALLRTQVLLVRAMATNDQAPHPVTKGGEHDGTDH